MNPEFFAYGSLPIYISGATAHILAIITRDHQWIHEWGHINLVGRHISAIFSTATLLLVYLLTRKILPPTPALVAVWFTATTPFLIQQAHFAVTESMLGFWAVLLTLVSLPLLRHPNKRTTVILGILWGMSVATKTSAVSFGVIPLVATVFGSAHQRQRRRKPLLSPILLFLITSALTYAIVSPYTFLSWNKFVESMRYEGNIVSGRSIVVYVYQFLGTKPYVYQLAQLPYTQGWVLAAASIIGYLWLTGQALKKKHWILLFVFLWPTLYTAYVGGWYAKFVRYLVPVYPFLAIAAAWFVAKLHTILKKFPPFPALLALLLSAPFLRSIAFLHIYTSPQTRIAASNWIYTHIPTGSRILTEHWDDGLPIPLSPEKNPAIFKREQLTIYEPDNEKKARYYAETLSSADYLFLNSRRLYGTLMHLTEKYPITSRYYALLFNGSLGYEKVAEFAVYPTLTVGPWRWEFNDDKSEETFQVYDHPKVMIFQNTGHLTAGQLTTILRQ